MIVIVDYEVGNLGSILNMFKKVGAEARISKDPELLSQAQKILLPGIGRFDHCMKSLQKSELIPVLEKRVLQDQIPTLGICVGFQMLARHSEEGDMAGLGWIAADVKKFKFKPSEKLKVPHMGWNWVHPEKDSPLTQGFSEDPRFYFAHSYYMQTDTPECRLLRAHYGHDFTCGVQQGNLYGVQFHPEKSHKFGMKLFKNFAELL